jgi:hypothetical protein
MKIICKKLVFMFLIFSFNTSLYAQETKCKSYNIACKVGKFVSDTKEFQKEEWSKEKGKLKIPKIKK